MQIVTFIPASGIGSSGSYLLLERVTSQYFVVMCSSESFSTAYTLFVIIFSRHVWGI